MFNWCKKWFTIIMRGASTFTLLPPRHCSRLHPKWKPGCGRNPLTNKTDSESLQSDWETVIPRDNQNGK